MYRKLSSSVNPHIYGSIQHTLRVLSTESARFAIRRISLSDMSEGEKEYRIFLIRYCKEPDEWISFEDYKRLDNAVQMEYPEAMLFMASLMLQDGMVRLEDFKQVEHYLNVARKEKMSVDYESACLYMNSAWEGYDPEIAYSCLERACEENNGHAIERMGDVYMQGLLGRKKDYVKAFSLYKRTARDGFHDVMEKARDAEKAHGAPLFDGEEYGDFLKMAAEKGYGKDMFLYALYLVSKAKVKDSLEWLDKAVQTGSVDAALMLSDLYAGGIGIPKNMDKSVDALKRVIMFGPEPNYELGLLYLMRTWKGYDRHQAAVHLWNAHYAGHPDAILKLLEIEYFDKDGPVSIESVNRILAEANKARNIKGYNFFSYVKCYGLRTDRNVEDALRILRNNWKLDDSGLLRLNLVELTRKTAGPKEALDLYGTMLPLDKEATYYVDNVLLQCRMLDCIDPEIGSLHWEELIKQDRERFMPHYCFREMNNGCRNLSEEEIISYLSKYADNVPWCMYYLAWAYWKGFGAKPDFMKAVGLLNLLMMQEFIPAHYLLARISVETGLNKETEILARNCITTCIRQYVINDEWFELFEQLCLRV